MASPRKGVVISPDDLEGVDWCEKMKQLGLNTLGIHSGEGPGVNCLQRLKSTIQVDFQENLRNGGIDYEYELHTGSSLLPRALFAKHPEFFTFNADQNRRIADANWCPSSIDAMRIVAENAKHMAGKLDPSTHRFFFWGDDAAGWCHCEQCRRLNDADQELMVSNHIAAALREVDPCAQVAFLAFEKSLKVPHEIKPADNVFLEFAPMRRCYLHSIDDASCAVNREHFNVLLDLLEYFPAERVHVLEYWLDSSLYSNYRKPAQKPRFIRDIVSRDIRAYYQLGIRSITSFAVFMDGEYFKQHGEKELEFYAEQLGSM